MRLVLLLLIFVASAAVAQQRLLDADSSESARASAMEVLRLLADGNIEGAAKASNAPERRREVLQDYRKRVGDDEFKRVFTRYMETRVVAEVALGPRRLIVWNLGDALSGQYFIEHDGRFLMDDVPSPARAELARILREFRSGYLKY
jgi:hypothetical protein